MLFAPYGKGLTQEEEFQLQQSLQVAVRLMTKAGVLFWKKQTQTRVSDFMLVLDGEVAEQDVQEQPVFACDINVQAGMLEEITSLPSLTGDNRRGTAEVGMKLALASYDEEDEEQGEMTLDIGLDVLADIAQSVREREEHLAELQAVLNSASATRKGKARRSSK